MLFDNKLETLDDLLLMCLKDLYSAETQLLDALPQMAAASKDGRLRRGFERHLRETEEQVKRLERIGQELQLELGGETCAAMQGLIKEGQKLMSENATEEVMDAALIGASQKIEHYEIACYGTAAHYADRLGYTNAADLLRRTLEEEQLTDTKLNELAKNYLNKKAE